VPFCGVPGRPLAVVSEVVQAVLSSKERAVSARQPPQQPPGENVHGHRRTHPQQTAAAKAGSASARRAPSTAIRPCRHNARSTHEATGHAPTRSKESGKPRSCRWCGRCRRCSAITILHELQRRHPGRFPDNQLRTLQRHSDAGARSPGLTATSSSARSIHPARRVCRTSPMQANFA
jgi:hypothetical protein